MLLLPASWPVLQFTADRCDFQQYIYWPDTGMVVHVPELYSPDRAVLERLAPKPPAAEPQQQPLLSDQGAPSDWPADLFDGAGAQLYSVSCPPLFPT